MGEATGGNVARSLQARDVTRPAVDSFDRWMFAAFAVSMVGYAVMAWWSFAHW